MRRRGRREGRLGAGACPEPRAARRGFEGTNTGSLAPRTVQVLPAQRGAAPWPLAAVGVGLGPVRSNPRCRAGARGPRDTGRPGTGGERHPPSEDAAEGCERVTPRP